MSLRSVDGNGRSSRAAIADRGSVALARGENAHEDELLKAWTEQDLHPLHGHEFAATVGESTAATYCMWM